MQIGQKKTVQMVILINLILCSTCLSQATFIVSGKNQIFYYELGSGQLSNSIFTNSNGGACEVFGGVDVTDEGNILISIAKDRTLCAGLQYMYFIQVSPESGQILSSVEIYEEDLIDGGRSFPTDIAYSTDGRILTGAYGGPVISRLYNISGGSQPINLLASVYGAACPKGDSPSDGFWIVRAGADNFELIELNSGLGVVSTRPISGIALDDLVVYYPDRALNANGNGGMDRTPDGSLYFLSGNGRVYKINPQTAVATLFDTIAKPNSEFIFYGLASYNYQLPTTQATFITHAVHGQVPAEFIPFVSANTPNWITTLPSGITPKIELANILRENEGLSSTVDHYYNYSDWTVETGVGTPLIATSRLFDIMGLYTGFNQITSAALEIAARITEFQGRELSGRASRLEAKSLFQTLRIMINSERAVQGQDRPIFIDLISHSRGTTVVSEALRLLAADPISNGPLEINTVYIDIIDSHGSQSDLVRPSARAGHLLGDQTVERRKSERIHHLVSECAAFCADPNCTASDLWFFTAEQLCEIQDLGVIIGDGLLESLGYPKGHVRPYLDAEFDEVILGTTHTSILEDFVSSGLEINPGTKMTPSPGSYGSSTIAGRYLTTGLLEELPKPVLFGSTQRTASVMHESRTLIIDPDFSEMGLLSRNASILLADSDVDQILTPAFEFTRELLEDAANSMFPSYSPWYQPVPGFLILQDDGNDEFSIQVFSGGVEQEIGLTNNEVQHWKIEAELTLFVDVGFADIELLTGNQTQLLWNFSIDSGDSIDERIMVSTDFVWDRVGEPAISITGTGFTVHRLDVRLVADCLGDLTGDGSLDFFDVSAFLTAFGQQDPVADFTGDGSFDFFDVSAFLQAFVAGCPFSSDPLADPL